jgi:hypothetical protein
MLVLIGATPELLAEIDRSEDEDARVCLHKAVMQVAGYYGGAGTPSISIGV